MDQISILAAVLTLLAGVGALFAAAFPGAQYLELSSDAERVADHLINVAATVRKYK